MGQPTVRDLVNGIMFEKDQDYVEIGGAWSGYQSCKVPGSVAYYIDGEPVNPQEFNRRYTAAKEQQI